jgi:hypothetical protein
MMARATPKRTHVWIVNKKDEVRGVISLQDILGCIDQGIKIVQKLANKPNKIQKTESMKKFQKIKI